MLQSIFQSLVEPALTYAASVLFKAVKTRSTCQILHRTQKHFLIKILQVWKAFVFEEVGFLLRILPIEYSIVKRASLYWCKRNMLKLKECSSILHTDFIHHRIELNATSSQTYTLQNITNPITDHIDNGEPEQIGWRSTPMDLNQIMAWAVHMPSTKASH